MFWWFVLNTGLGQKGWTIYVNRTVLAMRGSEVIIHCRYQCPLLECNGTVLVHWKKRIGDSSDGRLKNQNEFVYHEKKEQVAERYRNKTQLLKNGTKNCSLKIQNVTDNDQDLYVRLETQKHPYSFYNDTVSISVSVSVSSKYYIIFFLFFNSWLRSVFLGIALKPPSLTTDYVWKAFVLHICIIWHSLPHF